MKKVEVVWRDITYKNTGWSHTNEVDDFIKDSNENTVYQLGYVYRETEDLLVLVDSYFLDDKNFGTIHKIPKGCIISVTVL